MDPDRGVCPLHRGLGAAHPRQGGRRHAAHREVHHRLLWRDVCAGSPCLLIGDSGDQVQGPPGDPDAADGTYY